jgi:hypothetical protein
MGVDFVAYSYVQSVPIPEKYCATFSFPDSNAYFEVQNALKLASTNEEKMLIMMLTGASVTQNSNSIQLPPTRIDSPLLKEFEDTIESEDKHIVTDFFAGCYYLRTDESKKLSTSRSYGLFNDFKRYLVTLNNGVCLSHFPSLIPQEDFFLYSSGYCRKVLQQLDVLKPKVKDTDLFAEMFTEFYQVIELASKSGILWVS